MGLMFDLLVDDKAPVVVGLPVVVIMGVETVAHVPEQLETRTH